MTDPVVLLSTGDVVGPTSATDGTMVLFDGTTGKKIKGNNAVVTAQGLALLDDVDATANRATIGLDQVNNTTDANKPVSTAQQTAINAKANKGANSDITSITGLTTALSVLQGGTGVTSSTGAGSNVLNSSPAFAGVPTAPTAAAGTNSTQVATTAFVRTATLFSGVKAQNGCVIMPDGVILQWGRTEGTANVVSFPAAFPVACYSVIATPISAVDRGAYDYGQVSSISSTGFGLNPYSSRPPACWFAVGV